MALALSARSLTWPLRYPPGSKAPASMALVEFVPQRAKPLAIVHSNAARFSAEQAARAMRTARVSSTVSITTMGVEESMSTFRRSRTLSIRLTSQDLLSYNNVFGTHRNISLVETKVTKEHGESFIGAEARPSDGQADRHQPDQHLAPARRAARIARNHCQGR